MVNYYLSCLSLTRVQSLATAIDDRPTTAHVHSMVQQVLTETKDSVAAVAAAAAQAATAPLQQQLQDAAVELKTMKRHLAEAQDDLYQLKEWKVCCSI